MSTIATIVFYLLIGLYFVGIHFQYQEPLIGLAALGLGAVTLFQELKQR